MRPSIRVSFILSCTTCGIQARTAADGLWFPDLQRPRTIDGSEGREPLLCKWASHFPLPAPPPSHPVSSHDSLQLAGLVPPTLSCPLLSGSSCLPPQPPCCESPLPGSRLGGAHGWRIGGGEGARRGQRIATFLSLEKGQGNESDSQRVLQLSLQLVLWACCVPGATPCVSLGSKVGCTSCPQPPACYCCLSGIFGIKQVVACNAPRWCLSCGRCCGPAASTWGQALPLSSFR